MYPLYIPLLPIQTMAKYSAPCHPWCPQHPPHHRQYFLLGVTLFGTFQHIFTQQLNDILPVLASQLEHLYLQVTVVFKHIQVVSHHSSLPPKLATVWSSSGSAPLMPNLNPNIRFRFGPRLNPNLKTLEPKVQVVTIFLILLCLPMTFHYF